MPIKWRTPKRLKASFLFYSAPGLAGGKTAVRLSLKGRRGDPSPSQVASMVIRAPIGTTIILMTHPGPDWQDHTWRAIRVLEGTSVPGEQTPMPGVRIPDLDFLDRFDAKQPGDGLRESYPLVRRFADGAGWTFGWAGDQDLSRNVKGIMVLRPGLSPEGVNPAGGFLGSATRPVERPVEAAAPVPLRPAAAPPPPSDPTREAPSAPASPAEPEPPTRKGRVFLSKPKPIVD